MNYKELERLKSKIGKSDVLEKIAQFSTGANLGLTIAQILSKAVGKKQYKGISVESSKDVGSSFTFFIYDYNKSYGKQQEECNLIEELSNKVIPLEEKLGNIRQQK